MNAGQPRLRVLVAENEARLRPAAEDMLQELGHDVVGSANLARVAITQAKRAQPDIVLMHIQLDGHRDGVDAARDIKDRFGITSLFVTGTGDNETYRRALLTGQAPAPPAAQIRTRRPCWYAEGRQPPIHIRVSNQTRAVRILCLQGTTRFN